MVSTRMRSLFVVVCVAAFVTVGCGKGSPLSSSGSPGTLLGPTALTADSEIDVAAASALTDEFSVLGGKEKGKGEDKDRGKSDDDDDDVEDADDDSRHANKARDIVSGFVTAVSATSVTVRNMVVTVNADTRIRHGYRTLTMADIQVGDKVEVKGTTATTTTGTSFTATEIKVEDMDHADDEGDGDGAKVKGVISGLTGTCPALTFTVGTTKVTTNASTKFDDAVCASLANGQTVEVKGTLQTDGSILAGKVEGDDDDLEDDDAKVEGKLSGLAGTCPALTFNVVSGTTTTTTTKVTTNNLTKFDDVLCTALANDAVVEVKGTKQADGSILATKVELD